MKKFAIVASIALLAACGAKKDAAADPAATESAMASAAATPAAVETPAPGSYDVTGPDGKTGTTTLMADGSYVNRDADGKVVGKGTMAVKDGKTCFTPEGGKPDECYTDSARAADGSFTATDAKGAVTQVKPHVK